MCVCEKLDEVKNQEISKNEAVTDILYIRGLGRSSRAGGPPLCQTPRNPKLFSFSPHFSSSSFPFFSVSFLFSSRIPFGSLGQQKLEREGLEEAIKWYFSLSESDFVCLAGPSLDESKRKREREIHTRHPFIRLRFLSASRLFRPRKLFSRFAYIASACPLVPLCPPTPNPAH